VDLYQHGIQPVWIEIENKDEKPIWFLPVGIDPMYFSPLEASFLSHFRLSATANERMDRYFFENGKDIYVSPGSIRSGFVFTNLDEGTKAFVVDLVGEDQEIRTFTFIASPFEDAIPFLKNRGVKIDVLAAGGRSSMDTDAAYLNEMIRNLDLVEDDRLLLVGYSTGIVDILQFLVNYPEASRRVDAVISVAGAVNGTPLAARLDTIYAEMARGLGTGGCKAENDETVESLLPAVRLSWLAAHPLPKSVHYFSLAAMTQRDHVNALLKTGYDLLWVYSPRNDGMLLITDQLIPGGTLLGYANADHWSVVIPLEDKHRQISESIRAPGKFPRSVLLQAMLVYVAESLEPGQE
jgi:pimeloyl-ACP methyl ester carboxylesterase